MYCSSLHVSGNHVPIIRRKHCTYATPGICHSIQMTVWYAVLCPVYQTVIYIEQCFSTAWPRPSSGPWHQLYRTARGSPGICHFSFLSVFSWINIL